MKSLLSCALVTLACLVYPPLAAADSVVITADAFVVANSETFSIGSSSGEEARNRVASPVGGTAQNLHLIANMAPTPGAIVTACVRLNGVDTNLCATYTSTDFPGVRSNLVNTVSIARGDVITVHFTETGNQNSGANIRASFQIAPPTWTSDILFADGFEVPAPSHSAVITGEPFLVASGDTYSIGSTAGDEPRNRAVAPRAGTIQHLYLLPNLQPAAGSRIQACLRKNGIDTPLCASYVDADWPDPTVSTGSVNVAQGDVITVHFTETNGVNSGANVRASFDYAGPVNTGAIVITAEPYVPAASEIFSIGGSTGEEARNSAPAPRTGNLRNFYILPDQQPAAGSQLVACVRVNGVDTALCATYTPGTWPSPSGDNVTGVLVQQGDVITVRFREINGVNFGANTRASFTVD
ncbi:hypothetical protein [Tahibacter amnicola]|uniref:Uncharacterized protein n=1 Tax=Tahibacter amnicola TaxID=2976241 RepID=A0ABY6BGI9_9GAMM|nr:hypothetical protein [Tahibacter amnicola]UXI68955.1 hypothetical protein N4264_04690 [Tahibacter amnicola]